MQFNFREWFLLENTVTQLLKDEKKYPAAFVQEVQQQVHMSVRKMHWAVGMAEDRLLPLTKLFTFWCCKMMISQIHFDVGELAKPNIGLVDSLVVRSFLRNNDDYLAWILTHQPAQARSKFNNPEYNLADLTADSGQWHERLKSQKRKSADPGRRLNIHEMPAGHYWVSLDKESCEKEGEAMGHCGNSGSKDGDNIYSMRDSKGVPHLTFIVNNSILGESKGYGNQKPEVKYHPHIVALLLGTESRTDSSGVDPAPHSIINYIKGGGYRPENNFHFDDLSQELQKKVLAVKPYINDYFGYVKNVVAGNDQTKFKEKLDEIFNFKFQAYLPEKETAVLTHFDDLDSLIKWLKDDTSSKMDEVPDLENTFDNWTYDVDTDDAVDMFRQEANDKNKERVTAIVKQIWDEMDEEHRQQYYDEDEEYEFGAQDAAEYDDRLGRVLSWAAEDGYRMGAEADAYRQLRDWFKDETDDSGFQIKGDDAGWRVIITLKDLEKLFKEKDDPEEWQTGYEDLLYQVRFNYREPYNGYSGFDEHAYNERLADLLSEEF